MKWSCTPNKKTVYIHQFEFNNFLNQLEIFRNLLTEEEKTRIDKFYFEKDQNNFTLSRGITRVILAKYLDINPKQISLSQNKFGKLYLENEKLKFNLSHTKDFLLIGVSFDAEIGIDIEKIREFKVYQEIVRRFFSENEIKAFFLQTEDKYQESFFTIWTRKEAFIKAVGRGLNIPLNDFDVSVTEKAELLDVRLEDQKKESWKLYNIPTKKNHKASLVTENDNFELVFYDETPESFSLNSHIYT